jgi:hypothetical protein
MWRNDQPMELAMTHRVGAGGQIERCIRPESVVTLAQRILKWTAQGETCQNCAALPAVSVRGGTALCGRCRDQRQIRLGRLPDSLGLAPKSVRADDEDRGEMRFEGLAIVFNAKSVDLGMFTEIIKPVAVDRMVAEKPDMRFHWSHNPDMTIGRVSAGTLRARKTSKGVAIENDPPRWAASYVESVRRRDVTGQSFGFMALEDDWHLEDGQAVREVLDMEVREFSPVAWPAYPQTTLKVVRADQRAEWTREQETAARLRLVR